LEDFCNDRQVSVTVAACLIMSFVALWLTTGQPADAQPAIAPTTAGRYQVIVTQHYGDETGFVFEPSSGRCWHRGTTGVQRWTDLGSPAIKVNE
jgi:hypothetical protein